MKTWDFQPVLPEYADIAVMLEETQSGKTRRALQAVESLEATVAPNVTSQQYEKNMDPNVVPDVPLYTIYEDFPYKGPANTTCKNKA